MKKPQAQIGITGETHKNWVSEHSILLTKGQKKTHNDWEQIIRWFLDKNHYFKTKRVHYIFTWRNFCLAFMIQIRSLSDFFPTPSTKSPTNIQASFNYFYLDHYAKIYNLAHCGHHSGLNIHVADDWMDSWLLILIQIELLDTHNLPT